MTATTDATDAQAAVTTALAHIDAGMALIGTDDSGAASSSGAPHDTAAKANFAHAYFDFTEVQDKVNAVLADVAPPVTTTPPPVTTPPATTGKPLWGEYHPGNFVQTPSIVLDYGDNNATTYSWTPQRVAYMKGRRPMIKLGNPTPAQAAQCAKDAMTQGHPDCIWPLQWEGNQGVKGWEPDWNELEFTATTAISDFLAIVAAMDAAAPGNKFTYVYCPNLNQVGNQASGRNQTDTCPGPGPNKNIVVGPDGYDNPGDTGSGASGVIAQLAPYEQLAAARGMKFAGLCETGDNGSDDPTFWTDLLLHAQANGWEWVVNFQATTQQGGSFNSTTGPNSIKAITAFYA